MLFRDGCGREDLTYAARGECPPGSQDDSFGIRRLRRSQSREQQRKRQVLVAPSISRGRAERAGRRPDELAVRTFAGALIGVEMSTMLAVIDDPAADYFELFDAGLAQLETGFTL